MHVVNSTKKYILLLFMQYTANASDYFGNKLRGLELISRVRWNFTLKVDRTQWITLDLGGAPTTINAFYNGYLNLFCKSCLCPYTLRGNKILCSLFSR